MAVSIVQIYIRTSLQGTFRCRSRNYAFNIVERGIFESSICILVSNIEEIRQCFPCLLLHLWSVLYRKVALCFLSGYFLYCFLSSGVIDGSEMDGLTIDAASCLVVSLKGRLLVFDPRVDSRHASGFYTGSLLNSAWGKVVKIVGLVRIRTMPRGCLSLRLVLGLTSAISSYGCHGYCPSFELLIVCFDESTVVTRSACWQTLSRRWSMPIGHFFGRESSERQWVCAVLLWYIKHSWDVV